MNSHPVKRPAPSSDAVPTASQCLRELRRFAKHQRCHAISTAKDAYKFLKSVGASTELTSFFRPCSKSDSQPCHLLSQLGTWNLFLQAVDMEIEEVAPEMLCVAPRYWAADNIEAGAINNLDAWMLIRWLFKKHHCVAQLRLPKCNRCPQRHIREALWKNSGLKTLSLICDSGEEEFRTIVPTAATCGKLERLSLFGLILSEDTVMLLEAFTKKLPVLKSLDISFSGVAPACDVQLLKGTFNRMSALTSLSLSADCTSPDVELVLHCLSPGLSTLDVDERFLEPRGGEAFQEFLAGNTVLKKLTLRQQMCVETSELDSVFKGLLLNHSLEELHLVDFGLDNPEMELLAEAVAEHNTLEILEVDFCYEGGRMDGTPLAKMLGRNKRLQELIFAVGKVDCYGAFAEAVRKNSTLKTLSLDLAQPDDLAQISVYREFLEALSCNDTIQLVTLGSICPVLVSSFCDLLRETGTERRVTFEVDILDAEMFTEALEKGTGLLQMKYSGPNSKVPVPPSAFWHLVHYYRLEDLDIDLGNQLIEDDAVTPLVRFFASTRTLTSLSLSFLTTPVSTHALLKGISRNRSLASLHISSWTFTEANANLLWQILRNSFLNDFHLSPGNDSDFQAFHPFPERLQDNYTLLSASFCDDPQDMKSKIKRVMQRNRSTLFRATLFVKGSRSRHYAEAFERVSRSLALMQEVSESEEEAIELLREAREYLDQHFLVVAGVVKRDVVCIDNGRLQLDRIGLDNWLHIRQYLRVADIKEPADELSACGHLPKRRRVRQ